MADKTRNGAKADRTTTARRRSRKRPGSIINRMITVPPGFDPKEDENLRARIAGARRRSRPSSD